MKKLHKLSLLLVALLGTSLSATAHDFEVDGIYYNITSSTDKTVEVTYSGSSYYAVENEYTGSVVIPETVTYSGTTYSVTSIGDDAFHYCYGLTSVTIPNSVILIGDWAFCDCSGLTSVTIPNSVTSIGNYAFDRCTGLTSVTIPNSVTSIGNSVFYGCTGLTSVTIPNSVTEIGNSVFSNCYGLTEITIPNSVTSIGDRAFSDCYGLTSVTIPNSVILIGDMAFSDCSDLTSITIPNSVTSIGNYAFYGCSGLTSIKVESGNAVYDSRDNCNAIIETASNTLVSGCKNTTIPNSVTSIGKSAFSRCTGLTSVTIPNSVILIGDMAFYWCTGLTSVTIPNYVTSISNHAFYGCTGLTSITSLNPEPPICVETSFRRVPTDCILYVPAGTKEAYANDTYWSYFTNIVELPEAGVDNIEAKQAAEVARYDIHGRLLTEPAPGINIVKYSDGSTRKEIVK